jgi:hypothetical protein
MLESRRGSPQCSNRGERLVSVLEPRNQRGETHHISNLECCIKSRREILLTNEGVDGRVLGGAFRKVAADANFVGCARLLC